MGHSFANLSTANMTKYLALLFFAATVLADPEPAPTAAAEASPDAEADPYCSIEATMVMDGQAMDSMDIHMSMEERKDLLKPNQKLNPRLTPILTYSTVHIIIIHTTATHT